MTRVLTEFTDKYPGSDQAFSAYNTLASIQTQANRNDEAAATYEKFIAKQPPGNPQVADALAREAALWLRAARAMGTFIVLTAPQREAWTADVDRSIAASERQLAAFPDAPATALGTPEPAGVPAAARQREGQNGRAGGAILPGVVRPVQGQPGGAQPHPLPLGVADGGKGPCPGARGHEGGV